MHYVVQMSLHPTLCVSVTSVDRQGFVNCFLFSCQLTNNDMFQPLEITLDVDARDIVGVIAVFTM